MCVSEQEHCVTKDGALIIRLLSLDQPAPCSFCAQTPEGEKPVPVVNQKESTGGREGNFANKFLGSNEV